VAAMSGDHDLAKVIDLHNKPRIGICKTPEWQQASPETRGAIALARFSAETFARGKVMDIKLPAELQDLTQVQTRIMLSEMSRSLAFERMQFPKKLSAMIASQIDQGAAIPYSQYKRDLDQTNIARRVMQSLFDESIDLIIAPSAIGEAPLLKDGTGDPLFCRSWTLLGLPCINLNISTGPNGLPIGVQLIAAYGQDQFLLSAARALALALPDPVLRDQA
jgi:Asp-tRNA(Asn)/Glu-tRNA(Gln) amidotransferase A subunit family amidase